MQVEIEVERSHVTKERITLELPYYYEHDCGGDDYEAMYHGKIEATRTTAILRSRKFGTHSFAFEIEVTECTPASKASCLKDEYKSTEAAYLKAKRDALEVFSGA